MASFTEYAKEYQKKKKKQEETNQTNKVSQKQSLTDYASEYRKRKTDDFAPSKTQDIAPVKTSAKKVEEEEGNFWSWLGNTALEGLEQFNKGLTATADLLLGKPLQAFGWEDNPISEIAEFYSDRYEDRKEKASKESEKMGGGGWNIAQELLSGTVSAAPDAALAVFTGGTSLAPTATKLSVQATKATGSLLTKAGLTAQSMAKNPQFWTSFARTYGTDYEEAVENGAGEMEAVFTSTITSLINAGIEIGIDGGSGFQGLPSKIKDGSKSAIRSWVQSSLEEGGEEVLQGFVNDVVAKVSYDTDREIANPEKMLKEFGMGAAIGGILGGGQIAVQSGVNAVKKAEAEKLTETEQKVFDKVYQDKIAEKEAEKGTKLTNKEKSTIYTEVMEGLKKGFISTDTIEEVLGGDTYKTYKDNLDSENARQKKVAELQKEYDELYKMKNGEKSDEQADRQAELKKLLENQKESAYDIDGIKSQLSSEVFELVKDSKLAESYYEKTKRGLAFKADLSQYDEKYRATIQSAIDSGILNDTRRTHEVVDFIAKVSADKGVPFDFSNNEKIKNSSFAVEGAIVNGYKTTDADGNKRITLNIESPKYLETVVGHEITHILEGTDLYDTLAKSIKEYAKSKGDYDGRVEQLKKLYKPEEIDTELVADLVGDYLFTDKEFVRRLSVENRNLFQKICDEIKYLCKVVTAGSKEAKQLEKVKKIFEDVYRSEVKTEGKTQHSLSTDSEGNALTDGQKEYFKDSKAVDRNGNLLKVYHTTKNDFTVFDKARKGEATEDANTYLGFFFSDDAEYMQNFPEFQNGKTESYYLNMKNPIDMTNISREAFLDIVEVMGGDVGDASILFDEELEAEHNRAKVRGDNNVSLQLGNLLDELTGEFYYDDFIRELKPHYDELMSKGYDGVINFMDELYGAKEYIVLDSEQAKLTSNENPSADPDTRYSLSSMANTFFGDSNMSANDFAKVDYKQTDGYKNYVDQCLNNMKQTRTDFDESVARQEIEDSIEGIVRVAIAAKKAGYDIFDDNAKRNVKDSKNRLLFSSLEPNSEYFTSNDISTICDKRKNFAEIYDDIVRAEEEKGVPQGKRFFDDVDNYFYLHKVLADKGLTQPCRECYVESMRKNLAPMANAFLRLVNETDANNKANDQLYQQKGKNKGNLKTNNAKLREQVLETLEEHPEYNMSASDLTVEMLTTDKGLAQLRIQAPLIYEAFNSFYGQSKPKMPKSATPFRFGELTALLTDHNGKINQKLVERIESTGGFRLQSYSDFQIQNYTDVLQVLFEAGTLGLTGHAYTKVPAFLEATEGTNLKRNISIFMYKDGDEWKLDKNDSFPYDLEEIYNIVKADKSGNTGIIAVSQNKDMSCWIMANDYIAYGIPFHKSGLKMGTVRDTDVKTEDGRIVKGYSGTIDHTKQQTEVWAKASDDHKALTKVKNGINIYSFWDFDNKSNLSKNELIEKNVKEYIKQCEIAGYLPKFRDYVINNDAVLNDVLKYSKELGFVEQNATIDDISFTYEGKYHTYRIPYGYYKFLGDFGMFTPDGKASPHDKLSLDNYDFDKAERFFADAEGLSRNEILQQFANGEERQKYRESNLSAEELKEIVRQKRAEVVEEIVPTQYSLSAEDIAPAKPSLSLTTSEDVMLEAPLNADETVAEASAVVDEAPITEDRGNFVDVVRNGDFYEIRGEEANRVAEALELKPFVRVINGEDVPAVGFPIRYLDTYNKKANKQGFSLREAQAENIAPTVEQSPIPDDDDGRIASLLESDPYAPFVDSDEQGRIESLLETEPPSEHPIRETVNREGEKIIGESQIATESKKAEKKKGGLLKSAVRNLVSKDAVFEKLSLEKGNRALQDKLKMWRSRSEAKAQWFMEHGKGDVKSLKSILDRAKKAGLETEFDLYVKHKHNIDRMKYDKAVFGSDVTSSVSQEAVSELEMKHPKFKEWAKDVYGINNYLRQMMVDAGLITQKTADHWAKTYPYYVPIERITDAEVDIQQDDNGTGISAPLKRAKGGNQAMETLYKTMAHRIMQTFKAIDKNNFGLELRNTIKTPSKITDEFDGELLKAGGKGKNPTFSVYENGKLVSFDITEEMYEALKPTSEALTKTVEPLHTASKWHKKVLTELNLFFAARNFPKDIQGAFINSKHTLKTFANIPSAVKQLATGKGEYVQEYWENGGKSNTYFDKNKNAFVDKSTFKKVLGFVPDTISKVNEFVEAIPRLSEYMASRKNGATIEAAMLDAARVTTDFSDGGDVTKFFNRNGATFLNASVQGAAQQVRNIREAKAQGFKGIMKLVGKYALTGLPVFLLNHLFWEDDEEYEELSDYVKDNYYIVAKYGDGEFVRIPKGREAAVIQELFEQIGNTATGEESDWSNVFTMAMSNLAPNNPLENNVVAPLIQAATNKTWYGDDLVPTRLQDVPAEEQYDETIDSISKWLGENTGISPYKINYVLNQYSGFIGDIVLPSLTPEAERGDTSGLGNFIAPMKDQFIVDSTMKNQNVSDFYEKVDELKVNANSSKATDEDILKNKYMSSVNSALGDLYKQKREIQGGSLPDSQKYEIVRNIQKQINSLAENALNSYESVNIQGNYATVGDKHYRLDDGTWTKISDTQLARQQEVTQSLGITPSEYWSKTDISYMPMSDGEYEYAYDNPENYTVAKAVGGYDAYRSYSKDLYNIKADKDASGKSISGSRKKKVADYINGLDIDYGEKVILMKSQYPSDDTYNMDIINYLNERDDISAEEMKTILTELGFTVYDDGRIRW